MVHAVAAAAGRAGGGSGGGGNTSRGGGGGGGGGSALQHAAEFAKDALQGVAEVGGQLPIVGAAAVLLLQVIVLCDQYRFNKKACLALNGRMEMLHGLYFGPGGIEEAARSRGKNSVMAPFAQQLHDLLKYAVGYLEGFTQKGFLFRVVSSGKQSLSFAAIDKDVTQCLADMSVALQMEQLAGQAQTYDMVCNIQAKVDAAGGLQGIQQLNPAQLQQLADELGVKDTKVLLEDVDDRLQQIGATVHKIDEGVQGVKAAVEGQDKHFMELRQMMEQLMKQNEQNCSRKSITSLKIDLSQWRLKERPVFDKSQLLGSGSFGQVYAGVYQGRKVAYKVLNGSVAGMSDLQKEVSLHLKVCSCPGVVQILAVSLQADAMCDVPCVVMERALGSLADFLYAKENLDNSDSSSERYRYTIIDMTLTGKLLLATQVASALEYISAAGLVHRDIKTSKILVFDAGEGTAVAKIFQDHGRVRRCKFPYEY
jgi:hypothetical protein